MKFFVPLLFLHGLQAQGLAKAVVSFLNSTLFPVVNVDPTVTKMLVPKLADSRRLAWFAGAAYCPATHLAEWDCSFCQKVDNEIEFVAELVHTKKENSGYVAIDHTEKEIIFAYRGTNNSANRVTDFIFFSSPFPVVPKKNVKIHSGFLDAALSLIPQSKKIFNELRDNPDMTNYTYTFVGHSLGGSMAVLAAIQIKYDMRVDWDKIKILTYGQPRTGNYEFAQWFNRQPVTMGRVVNARDPIPHFLSGTMRYFAHHQHEIFIEPSNSNTKTARVCNDTILEDSTCSNSILPALYDGKDHSLYFDADFRVPCS